MFLIDVDFALHDIKKLKRCQLGTILFQRQNKHFDPFKIVIAL